ncbi:MAG TPA: glycoside hydrolase family 3 N-terminal domain-containing protein [Ilumatobacteraceae bacterium]
MTLNEKVAQLGALWVNETTDESNRVATHGVTADELAAAVPDGIGQLTRPAGSAPDAVSGRRLVADVQSWLADNTRLGIPAIVHEECLTGLMASTGTVTPSPLNLGATFDADAAAVVGVLVGEQLAAVGAHLGLGPVLDVPVDQRWGRVEECFAEDPWLAAVCAAAYVSGMQQAGVGATAKHFVGHGSSLGGHNCGPIALGARQLAERDLLVFEAAIDAGVESVMAAYHDIDGVPVCADSHLLTDVLRGQLGFEGVVVSDYWAIDWLHEEHCTTDSRASSAITALDAGVDVELPYWRCYRSLADAVHDGRISVALVDRAVLRVLAQKFRLGLFDRPLPAASDATTFDAAPARAICRSVAAAGITLVQNSGVLPLAPDARVLVCGPNAHSGSALCGNYSWANHVGYRFGVDSGYPGVADQFVARHASVDVLPGCSHIGDGTDDDAIAAAVAVAVDVDVVVVVVGDMVGHFNRGTVGEGSDRNRLDLPGRQAQLVQALCDTGTPVVVLHVGGRAFDLGDLAERCAAVVCAWLPGESGADAIVDVLTGAVDATGRLPITIGRMAGAQPAPYWASKLARREYVDATGPVWGFGHGLSYTTFEFTNGTVHLDADEIVATVDITNTGARRGVAVPQCYITDLIGSTVRPELELRGVARVPLDVAGRAVVEFHIPLALLGVADADGSLIVEPGEFVARIGSSAAAAVEAGRIRFAGPPRLVGRPRSVSSSAVVVTLTSRSHDDDRREA